MPFNLTIPRSDGSSLDVIVNVGQPLFLLGANGAGKSALMHWFYFYRFRSGQIGTSRRISAHRQTWFAPNANSVIASQRLIIENNIQGGDLQHQARWQD